MNTLLAHPAQPSNGLLIVYRYAQIWEDETLRFFEVTVVHSQAVSLVKGYASDVSVPPSTDTIDSDVTYYGLALDGSIGSPVVPVMNTDDCFRHFLVNSTNQTQLSAYLSQTADHILKPFPVGLATDVGLLVANPAYSGNRDFAQGFSQDDYHGTVVWSWQLAMMGAGLSRQLGRCGSDEVPGKSLRILYSSPQSSESSDDGKVKHVC